MKRLLRWLAKILGSALTLILVIILFPYFSRLASTLMPDESGAAIKTSAILAARLENSARLETLKVSEDGVLYYEIEAAFLGPVASISSKYTYDASFGIDLTKINLQLDGKNLMLNLPAPELLQDALTPDEVMRDDFWYPGFSDQDYEKLFEDERLARRTHYLSGEQLEQLKAASIDAVEATIATWMKELDADVNILYAYQVAE